MSKRVSLGFMSKLLVVLFCLGSFAFTADAQRRKTPAKKAPAKPAATVATTTPPSLVNTAVKDAVSGILTQITAVSRFVYILGGVASGIEELDTDIRNKKNISRAAIDLNTKNKENLLKTIRNLRAALSDLENKFNADLSLRNYTVKLGGITNLAEEAESQASSGQLIESGKKLLLVIDKLSNTLALMPSVVLP